MCFRKFQLTKNVVPKREKLRFLVESLLSHSAEKLRREPFSGVTTSGNQKTFCLREKTHDCLSKSFCHAKLNGFVVEPFYVSESFGYRIFLKIRKVREIKEFLSNFFCLIVKKFRREPFSVSRYRKYFFLRGLGQDFLWIFFVSRCQNFS